MSKIDWKSREIAAGLRVPEDSYLIIRADGWRFHPLTKELNFEKPFDERMMRCMVEAAKEPFSHGLPVILSFTFSDEVSFLLKPPLPFRGRAEKLDSVFASMVSSAFSSALRRLGLEARPFFDSRVVLIHLGEVRDYLCFRQAEAWRNCMNSYAHQALLSKGLSPRRAFERLKGMKSPELHDLVFSETGVNLNEVPAWQRRGVLVFLKTIQKKAFDLKKRKEVVAERRELEENWHPPPFSSEEGRRFVEKILTEKVLKSHKGHRVAGMHQK